MIIEGEDGITHINVYSKGVTEMGRWLSNFSYCPIEIDGVVFNSVEAYWYFLLSGDISIKDLYGWEAKSAGQKLTKLNEIDQDKIKEALDIKIKKRSREISEINLPICHYYQYGGKKVDAGYEWIIEHLEKRVKQLKEHYASKNIPRIN